MFLPLISPNSKIRRLSAANYIGDEAGLHLFHSWVCVGFLIWSLSHWDNDDLSFIILSFKFNAMHISITLVQIAMHFNWATQWGKWEMTTKLSNCHHSKNKQTFRHINCSNLMPSNQSIVHGLFQNFVRVPSYCRLCVARPTQSHFCRLGESPYDTRTCS